MDTPAAQALAPWSPGVFRRRDDTRYSISTIRQWRISPDRRFLLEGGREIGQDPYVAPAVNCPDCELGRLADVCGDYAIVPLGWRDESTVVALDYRQDETPSGLHAVTIANRIPTGCTDLLSIHAQAVVSAGVRPDVAAGLIRPQSENGTWYAVDLTQPGAVPVEYSESLPNRIVGQDSAG